MDTLISEQCFNQHIGAANQVVSLSILLQALFSSKCAISTAEKWPEDYGPIALQNGNFNK